MKPVPFPRRHRAFACLLAAALVAAVAAVGAGAAAAAPKRPKKDTDAPVVEHTPVATHNGAGPVVISARITDDSAIYEPTLVVRMAGAATGFTRVPLVKGEGETYSAEVPVALLSGDVEYLVEAFDENGNGPSRVGDESAPLKIVRDVPVAVGPVKPADDAIKPDDGTAESTARGTIAPTVASMRDRAPRGLPGAPTGPARQTGRTTVYEWLGRVDSNHERRSQSPVTYH